MQTTVDKEYLDMREFWKSGLELSNEILHILCMIYNQKIKTSKQSPIFAFFSRESYSDVLFLNMLNNFNFQLISFLLKFRCGKYTKDSIKDFRNRVIDLKNCLFSKDKSTAVFGSNLSKNYKKILNEIAIPEKNKEIIFRKVISNLEKIEFAL